MCRENNADARNEAFVMSIFLWFPTGSVRILLTTFSKTGETKIQNNGKGLQKPQM